eukprot:573433-Pyramimonas_sp.AAC.1
MLSMLVSSVMPFTWINYTTKGNSVDVKGKHVDVKGKHLDVKGNSENLMVVLSPTSGLLGAALGAALTSAPRKSKGSEDLKVSEDIFEGCASSADFAGLSSAATSPPQR